MVPPIVGEVLASSGQPLDAAVRADLEPRFGHDFSQVRVHTDARAAESAAAVDALAYTVGRDVVFGAGQYAPESGTGQRLLAHELTHVVQQQDVGAGLPVLGADLEMRGLFEREAETTAAHVVAGGEARSVSRAPVSGIQRQSHHTGTTTITAPPNTLDAYPFAERRQIQVSLTPLTPANVANLNQFFLPPTGGVTMTTPAPATVTVVLGPGIATSLATPLNSTVGTLLGGMTPNPLPLNTTLAIEIAPTGMIFRFTHLSHTTAPHTQQDVVLIESLGAIPTAQSSNQAPTTQTPSTQTPAPQAQPVVSAAAQLGQQRMQSHSLTIASGWSPSEVTLLQEAVSLIPDSAIINGVRFLRAGTNTTNPNEAGFYDEGPNTITIYNLAFVAVSARAGPATLLAQTIAHEFGHAADYAPLNTAWNTFNTAGQTAQARTHLLAARSRSGKRWHQANPTAPFDEVFATSDLSGAFRQAAHQDGGGLAHSGARTLVGTAATLTGGITSYADTDWGELFAETFSMYAVDPTTLRLLRPHIYNFFAHEFPDPARPVVTIP